jgi:hypothetical protein
MTEIEPMLFIQNIGAVDTYPKEYEVVTDAAVMGQLSYKGLYDLMLWDMPNKPPGQTRKLCLRVREKVSEPSNSGSRWDNATKSGYYHGGGIADEILTVASLALRKRFKLRSIVRFDDIPLIVPQKTGWIDKPLIGEGNLYDIGQLLETMENLDIKYHNRFILAARFYYRALLMIEEEPDLAYLSLISAIEVLCQDTSIPPPPLKEISQPLAQAISRIESDEIRDDIISHIIRRERFISRKFVQFIMKHITDDFWPKSTVNARRGGIMADELPHLLKKIYAQRSRTLHDGEPFPPNIFRPPRGDEDFPLETGILIGTRKWQEVDFIPYPHFFERLVNHVLKNFLRQHTVA